MMKWRAAGLTEIIMDLLGNGQSSIKLFDCIDGLKEGFAGRIDTSKFFPKDKSKAQKNTSVEAQETASVMAQMNITEILAANDDLYKSLNRQQKKLMIQLFIEHRDKFESAAETRTKEYFLNAPQDPKSLDQPSKIRIPPHLNGLFGAKVVDSIWKKIQDQPKGADLSEHEMSWNKFPRLPKLLTQTPNRLAVRCMAE